jgi:alpha-L-arabinofuranosidase
MKAKELEGYKGFNINVGQKDENNRYLWEIGGWQNQDTAISEFINGRGSCLSQCLITVEKNKEYELELRINGRFIETWIDGKAYHAIESKPVIIEPLYYSASKEDATGDIIVKVVNVSEINQKVTLDILNLDVKKATIYSMEGYSLEEVNDFEHSELVVPVEWELDIEASCFEYEFKQQSITIFRLR